MGVGRFRLKVAAELVGPAAAEQVAVARAQLDWLGALSGHPALAAEERAELEGLVAGEAQCPPPAGLQPGWLRGADVEHGEYFGQRIHMASRTIEQVPRGSAHGLSTTSTLALRAGIGKQLAVISCPGWPEAGLAAIRQAAVHQTSSLAN